MTTLTKLYSVINGLHTYGNVVMPSWLAKTIIIGEMKSVYDYIATDLDKKIHSKLALKFEEAVIGDNYVTYLLNKGFESYLGVSNFIASKFNEGVYEIADKSSKVIYAIDYKLGITDQIYEFGAYLFSPPSDDMLEEYFGLAPKVVASEQEIFNYKNINNTISVVSAIGAYSYESLSNTVSAVYEIGTSAYEGLNNTFSESIKSDIEELDLGNQFFIDYDAIIWSIS